ncbi:MAG TPA: hypothetical protein VHL80_17760 [Polyangia bacterium]|nr:hypothetical protein [Polyangia bacterium]
MKRPATVSHFARIFVTTAALAVGAIGCGSGNGGGGTAGNGGAGTGGNGRCNALPLFNSTKPMHTCSVVGLCHDAAGSAAGLDLLTAGWQNHLVGVNPVANKGSQMSNYSMCVGHGPYLVANSNPATGLFLDKLKASPPCGVHMPNLPENDFSDTELACIQDWATGLTTGM